MSLLRPRLVAPFIAFVYAILGLPLAIGAAELTSEETTVQTYRFLKKFHTEVFKNKGGDIPVFIYANIGDVVPTKCTTSEGTVDYTVSSAYYCRLDNQIVLPKQELDLYRSKFGDGGVVFIMLHEYAHSLQEKLNIRHVKPYKELVADCFASAIMASPRASEELGVQRSDLIEMLYTAHALGNESIGLTHGTKEQRLTFAGIGTKNGVDGCLAAASSFVLNDSNFASNLPYDPYPGSWKPAGQCNLAGTGPTANGIIGSTEYYCSYPASSGNYQ
jgi:hypothetical protein